MNRKAFFSSTLTLLGTSGILKASNLPDIDRTGTSLNIGPQTQGTGFPIMAINEQELIIPPYLQGGDIIGITCPAGSITMAEIQAAVRQVESWGFRIKVGDTVGQKDFSFGGTDAQRLADLQQMMDDPTLKAILCARGGYGAVRIIDRLNLDGIRRHPKWVIGFSDITVILCHLHRHLNMTSIHSKMCNSFPDDWSEVEPLQADSILSIRKALSGENIAYPIQPNQKNKKGTGQGQLIGGNLKMIETLAGTLSDIDTKGKILFVEDTGEYLYSIDRMFWNLARTGKLAGLQGLIIGGFKIKPDDPGEEFGRSLYDIVLARVEQYGYPVCFDFPVGHQKNNFALKYGVVHTLSVREDRVELNEAADAQLLIHDQSKGA